MDRFIVFLDKLPSFIIEILKSNMDRFIVSQPRKPIKSDELLKSNMDRFIELTKPPQDKPVNVFKIQYG